MNKHKKTGRGVLQSNKVCVFQQKQNLKFRRSLPDENREINICCKETNLLIRLLM